MNGIEFLISREWNNKQQRHKADKKILINPLRTTSIFHFTKEIDILCSILRNGIIPNYCSENLYHDEEVDITLGIPMVSFCDIPLSRTYRHTKEYGNYGIGLATEYAEDHNINPVLYVSNDRIIRDSFPSVFNRDNRNARCVLPTSIQGLLKRIYGKYNDKEINNYTENEWRYFVKNSKTLPWFRSMEKYLAWRGNGSKPSPLNNPYLIANKLTFDYRYINHIIVKNEKEVPYMIDYIQNLTKIGGCDEELSNKDKVYLINHITSFERIRRDF